MAQKRMFSLKIIDTDLFLDLPSSTQSLYFHLSMRADDDGFISSPKKIMRFTGAKDDDMKLLIVKKFVITFETGICVIRHWKLHNSIQKDRYTETLYLDEKNDLFLNENIYSRLKNTECIQDVNKMESQVSKGLGLDKVRLDKERKENIYIQIFDHWKSCNLIKHRSLTKEMKKNIELLLNEFTVPDIIESINNYNEIYNSNKTYFNHNWTLEEFLSRKKGMRVFLYKTEKDYLSKSDNKKQLKRFEYDEGDENAVL